MAKKPKKAPAAEGDEAAAPRSRKKLVMIAAGAVALLGIGGGVFMMKGGGHGAEASEGHGEAHADAHGDPHGGGHGDAHGGGETKKGVVFVEVRDMLVNLAPEPGQPKGGFLKLKVALELKDAKVEEAVKPLMPRVEDAFQTYMRELRPSDLAGSAGLYRLREELLRRVNVAIHPAKAEAVLFKDVVVQ